MLLWKRSAPGFGVLLQYRFLATQLENRTRKETFDVGTFKESIHNFCRNGQAMEAHRIFEMARQRREAASEIDASVFSSLFLACANEGLGKLGLKTLAKMRKLGFHPTRQNLSHLIEAIAKSPGKDGQMEQMMFLEEMVLSPFWRERHCFGPALLAAYARLSKRFDTVDASLRVMRSMHKSNTLDKFVFTQTVSAYVEQHMISQMARLCSQGMSEFNMASDSRVFLVMMKGFALLRDDQRKLVFELYEHMLQNNLPIDKYILTVVLRTAKELRNFELGAKIVGMVENNPHKIGWDLPLLNELMAVASHAPDAPKLVDRILKEMDTRHISKDVSTYNLRISLFARLQRIDQAFDLLREMAKDDVLPNEATFTSLLTACRACRDAERAWKVFEAARKNELPLDNPIHSSLYESIFVQTNRPDLDSKWRAAVAEWKASIAGKSKESSALKPYGRHLLTPQQLKRASKVSESRKAFQRKQAAQKRD